MKKKCKLTYRSQKFEVNEGGLLSEVLIKEEIIKNMPCGGMGRCGKCRVKFCSGASAVTVADRSFFSEEQLKEGYRLSCRAVIRNDAILESVENGSDTEIDERTENGSGAEIDEKTENSSVAEIDERIENSASTEFAQNIKNDQNAGLRGSVEDNINIEASNKIYSIAIDIGTTTIGASLIEDGLVGRKMTIANSQAVYGADVISRIQAACNGKSKVLQEAVAKDICKIIKSLIVDNNIKNVQIRKIVFAGNTTMLHILMGDSCEGLGRAPYRPERLSYPVTKLSEMPIGRLLPEYGETECIVLPGISAFVGADIVSGMYALSFDKIPEGKRYMLIDLGTNGEMAVADSERISVCSTAAGPVFEGGGISCGMAGVSGAIEHVTLVPYSKAGKNEHHADTLENLTENKRDKTSIETKISCDYYIDIKTINNKEPSGICGSGVLELVSELRRSELIDETGLLRDDLFETGIRLYKDENGRDITFWQDDIRAVQLAKAAIRSGIDTLLKEHGCRASDIDRVFLAGGFSEHLDAEKIKYLKMLPKEFLREGLLTCAGNTSLLGTEAFLTSKRNTMENLVNRSVEVPLAETDSFSEEFLEAMNF